MPIPTTPLPYPPPVPPTGKTALIVDDEPVVRLLAKVALGALGFAVAEAGTAAATEKAMEEATAPFDVILLDLTLGKTDGGSLIPGIRRRMPEAAILVVSGLGEEHAADLGADGFLPKPFTKATLAAGVQAALRRGEKE